MCVLGSAWPSDGLLEPIYVRSWAFKIPCYRSSSRYSNSHCKILITTLYRGLIYTESVKPCWFFLPESIFSFFAGDREVAFFCHGGSPIPGYAVAGQWAEFLLVLILKL